MSEELRPLSEYTSLELVKCLAGRVSIGVFVIAVGDPSAEETLRAQKIASGKGTPLSDYLYMSSDSDEREKLEEMYRCLGVALSHRLTLFAEQYGSLPRCCGGPS